MGAMAAVVALGQDEQATTQQKTFATDCEGGTGVKPAAGPDATWRMTPTLMLNGPFARAIAAWILVRVKGSVLRNFSHGDVAER
jgi:hypothetical protein